MMGRDEDDTLTKALCLKVEGQRKWGRLRKTWRRQVEEKIRGNGLQKEDALDQARWRNGVRLIMSERR